MDYGRLVHTLKELYNYMEDRADEEGRNEEYRFLFKIHKGLIGLGAGSPEDDKFGIAGKEEPMRLSTYSAEEIGGFLDSQKNNFQPKKTPGLNEEVSRIKNMMGLNESDSSNRVKELWEKISEISKNYYDALKNLNDVGCDDSETYAEYYHSSGQMEPGDHDDYDDNDYHDNGYSHSQQTSADRLDYANSAEDPITRAERRMGA